MIDVSNEACACFPKLTPMQRFAMDGLKGYSYLEFDSYWQAVEAADILRRRHPELWRVTAEGCRVKLVSS